MSSGCFASEEVRGLEDRGRLLQNYPHFTGDMVLGLGIPGGRTDMSTRMVLKGPGEAERQGGEELQRGRRKMAGETGAGARV